MINLDMNFFNILFEATPVKSNLELEEIQYMLLTVFTLALN